MNPMDRRTRILATAAAAVAALFLMDKAATAFWFDPWDRTRTELAKADVEIARAKATLAREAALKKEWSDFKAKVERPRAPDLNTHFVRHLGEICDRLGATFEIAGNPQPLQAGDFREYAFDMKLKVSWTQFVDLLGELHQSREFLKVLRISIQSQYEREDRLDVDLKLSTIEYSPAPAKPGSGGRP
jgi:hypothetical protein